MSGEAAASAVREYLERVPLPLDEKRRVLESVRAESDPARAMAAVHRLLGGGALDASPANASLRRRVELACAAMGGPWVGRCLTDDPGGGGVRLVTTPRLRRTPMAPAAELGRLRPLDAPVRAVTKLVRATSRRPRARANGRPPDPAARVPAWQRTGSLRPVVLAARFK